MRFIAALERRLERLFERPPARLFSTTMQPLQLQRRLERALDEGRLVGTSRVYAPDEYLVHLAPADLSALLAGSPDVEERLAGALAAQTRRRGYYLQRQPVVSLVADPGTPRGEPRVAATVSGGTETPGEDRFPGEATAVYRAPPTLASLAVIVVTEPSAEPRRVRIDGGLVRIGRAADNHVALEDPRVSRYHGELVVRRGTLVYRDLRSTNGSWVNGVQVRETAVGLGDRIEVGDTSLVVEPL